MRRFTYVIVMSDGDANMSCSNQIQVKILAYLMLLQLPIRLAHYSITAILNVVRVRLHTNSLGRLK